MQGVTTAIVAFLLAAIAFPRLIKNKPQYYAAVGLVLVIIFFDALAFAFGKVGFAKFVYFLTAVLQIGAIGLILLSAGGMSVSELRGDLGNAYEVMRRGGEEKEVIVPLRGEVPMPRRERGGGAGVDPDILAAERELDELERRQSAGSPPAGAPAGMSGAGTTPATPPPPPPPTRRPDDADTGIPLA